MNVPKNASDNLKRLPDWVKCMVCQGKPTKTDWLIEVVPNSNALIHQSCAAGRGQMAGMNIGVIPNLGEKS